MILADFVIPNMANANQLFSGSDSRELCVDKEHFDNYQYKINYEYNSRGYRDAEWPVTIRELKDCIWCFGDSHTVGMGSPKSHTWTSILEKETNTRCINVSMGGASNDWIARKVINVIETICPDKIVIHWSYLHRYEIDDITLSDDERRGFVKKDEPLIETQSRFINHVARVRAIGATHNVKIIHSMVPHVIEMCAGNLANMSTPNLAATHWKEIRGDSWPKNIPDSLEKIHPDLVEELSVIHEMTKNQILEKWPVVTKFRKWRIDATDFVDYAFLDISRDGIHYDKLTSIALVKKIIERL